MNTLCRRGTHWMTLADPKFISLSIDHNPSWEENQRQNRESFWIREIQT